MRCVSSFWPMYTAARLSQEIPSGFSLLEERRSKQGRGWGTEDLLILGSHRDPGKNGKDSAVGAGGGHPSTGPEQKGSTSARWEEGAAEGKS